MSTARNIRLKSNVPPEIRPLLYWHDTPEDAQKPFEIDDDQPPGTNAHINAMILEAFRRGQRAGSL